MSAHIREIVVGLEQGLAWLVLAGFMGWLFRRFLHPRFNRRMRLERIAAVADKGTSDPEDFAHAQEFITRRYTSLVQAAAGEMLEWGSLTYPCALFPASPVQHNDLESALAHPLDYEFSHGLVTPDSAFRESIECSASFQGTLEDRETYALRGMDTAAGVRIRCGMGRFFDSLDTGDSLAWELARQVGSGKRMRLADKTGTEFERRFLANRRNLHNAVENPVVDGTGRSVGVGISVVVIYDDGNTMQVLLHRRSRDAVATQRGRLAIVPFFMFQPLAGEFEAEYSVRHNIMREYLEELFDEPEQDHAASATYFYGHPEIKFLGRLLDSGQAQLLYTGVAVNLLNLRPDICALLLIQTPEWYEAHNRGSHTDGLDLRPLKYNYEYEKTAHGITRLTAEQLLCPTELGSLLLPHDIAPSSAGAIELAARILRERSRV